MNTYKKSVEVENCEVPLKTSYSVIKLRVPTDSIAVSQEGGSTLVGINVPCISVDTEALEQNIMSSLDEMGIARGAASRAIESFRETLKDELTLDALRDFIDNR